MYLFDLDKSNIKSEALAQECSKSQGILKNSDEFTGKQPCAGVQQVCRTFTKYR